MKREKTYRLTAKQIRNIIHTANYEDRKKAIESINDYINIGAKTQQYVMRYLEEKDPEAMKKLNRKINSINNSIRAFNDEFRRLTRKYEDD